jgi:hypothetical protein
MTAHKLAVCPPQKAGGIVFVFYAVPYIAGLERLLESCAEQTDCHIKNGVFVFGEAEENAFPEKENGALKNRPPPFPNPWHRDERGRGCAGRVLLLGVLFSARSVSVIIGSRPEGRAGKKSQFRSDEGLIASSRIVGVGFGRPMSKPTQIGLGFAFSCQKWSGFALSRPELLSSLLANSPAAAVFSGGVRAGSAAASDACLRARLRVPVGPCSWPCCP